MSAPTSGLARVTIRAPRRRLDVAMPAQVPLAELLPELVRRAGPSGPQPTPVPPGGWVLRRGDGRGLAGDSALAAQGVRDGDVLYLVPADLSWPEPSYDDVAEEIAATARERGRAWDASATRMFALVAAGLVLATGLAVAVRSPADGAGVALAVGCAALLITAAVLSRVLGDGLAGAAAGGFAVAYAAASGAVLFGAAAGGGLRAEQVLVGACAMLLASVLGAVAVGDGLRVFVAGAAAGALAAVGGLLAFTVGARGGAALVILVAVAGLGVAPLVAVRLGRLPLPVVVAGGDDLAGAGRADRPALVAAVARAEDLLAGCLLGLCVVTLGCVGVLVAGAGLAGPLLAGLASLALVLRARAYPSVAMRLPLLTAGMLGSAIVLVRVAAAATTSGWPSVQLGVGLALVAVLVLLGTAAAARRGRRPASPYLGRIADVLDVAVVVALAPVAGAVLGLYAWVRGFAG